MSSNKKPKVVTFYSYKGGTGRTTAAANVASMLAKGEASGRNVLILDLDFDGPGMALVMGIPIEEGDMAMGEVRPLQDYIADRSDTTDISEFYIDVCSSREQEGLSLGGSFEKGRIFLMPSRIGYTEPLEIRHQESTRLVNLLAMLAEDPQLDLDYIILDGASGVSDAAMLGLSVADLVFSLMRLSYQHVSGSVSMVEYLKLSQKIRSSAGFQPVATVVPETLSDLENDYRKFYLGILTERFGTEPIIVPEIHTLKWEERVLLFEESPESRNSQSSYQPLVDFILNF